MEGSRGKKHLVGVGGALALAFAFVLVGCDSAADARKELTEIGVQYTPQAFVVSARNNDLRAVELFLDAGMGVDIEVVLPSVPWKTTALKQAAEHGHADIVDVLLQAGAEPDSMALAWAAGQGHADIVDVLLQAGAEPDLEALKNAARLGRGDIVDALLQAGVEPDSALEAAAGQGHADIVDVLLQAGAEPDSEALYAAAEHADIVDALLQAGAEPDSEMLVWAVQGGRGDFVDALLQAGVESDLEALLVEARRRVYPNIVYALVQAGAEPDSETLVWAVSETHADFVDALLQAGVEPDSEALKIAAARGNADIVDVLLRAGAEPDPEALVWAVRRENADIVDALLQAGAKPASAALKRAMDEGHADIVDALVQAGGDFCEAAESAAPCITVRTPEGCGGDCAGALVERLKARLGPDVFAGLKAWGDTECESNWERGNVDCPDFKPGCVDFAAAPESEAGMWARPRLRFIVRAAGDSYHSGKCESSRASPKRMPGMFYVRANEQRAAD